MAGITNNTLSLEFPAEWADHPPPPLLSNDEYADWIERELEWLPERSVVNEGENIREGPSTCWFQL